MLTRCPKCGKEIEETLDICPHCKYDFTKQVIKGTGRRIGDIGQEKAPPKKPGKKDEPDLPAHMLAEMNAPPKEESVLPPHMLEGAAGTEADLVKESEDERVKSTTEKSGSPVFYLLMGAVICGAILAPKFLKKDPPPPPVAQAPEPAAPATPTAEEKKADEDAEKSAGKKDEEKNADGTQKKFVASDAPEIDDAPAPRRKSRRGKSRRRVARAAPAPDSAPHEDAPAPKKRTAAKFRIRGAVLNLVTLEGVPDATLTFTEPGGQTLRTESGNGGKFRITLPGNAVGYELTISHKDYDSKWLPEDGHKGMSEDERKEISEALIKSYPKNAAILPSGDGSLKQEFVLVPRPKHGMTMEEALAQ